MSGYATLGAVVLGIGLLILNIGTWWPGYRQLRKSPTKYLPGLAPFLYGYAFGTLAILCAGGLLGWAADFTLWGGGWLGDGALIYGVGGFRENVSRGPEQALTNGGHAMVLVLCFVTVVLLRRRPDTKKATMHGTFSGVLLGTVKGVAGVLAIPLASAVNLAGAWLSTGVLH